MYGYGFNPRNMLMGGFANFGNQISGAMGQMGSINRANQNAVLYNKALQAQYLSARDAGARAAYYGAYGNIGAATAAARGNIGAAQAGAQGNIGAAQASAQGNIRSTEIDGETRRYIAELENRQRQERLNAVLQALGGFTNLFGNSSFTNPTSLVAPSSMMGQ